LSSNKIELLFLSANKSPNIRGGKVQKEKVQRGGNFQKKMLRIVDKGLSSNKMELLFIQQIKVLTLEEEISKKEQSKEEDILKKKKECCALPNILVVPNWRKPPFNFYFPKIIFKTFMVPCVSRKKQNGKLIRVSK